MVLKRTRSEDNLRNLQEVKQQKQSEDDFLNAIMNLQKPELEKSWREEESFSLILLDTYTLKGEDKLLAKCLSKLTYPGNVYLLRMHGSLLSYPFSKKFEKKMTKQDVKRFFCHTGARPGSPNYMTMLWVHYALERNHALNKVQKIVVLTNNLDDPSDALRTKQSPPDYFFTTRNGHPLIYNVLSRNGKRIQSAVLGRLQIVLNKKWILATRNSTVQKSFVVMSKNKPVCTIYTREYDKMKFQLSKALEPIVCFKPSLKISDEILLDRSDSEMQNYHITHYSFGSKSAAISFLKENRRAKVLKEILVLHNYEDDNHGPYKKFVKGFLVETAIDDNFVRYLLLGKAKVVPKHAIVTLKENVTTKNTNYLMRPCATKYRVEREDCSGFYLKQLNDQMQVVGTEYLVPKSYVCFV